MKSTDKRANSKSNGVRRNRYNRNSLYIRDLRMRHINISINRYILNNVCIFIYIYTLNGCYRVHPVARGNLLRGCPTPDSWAQSRRRLPLATGCTRATGPNGCCWGITHTPLACGIVLSHRWQRNQESLCTSEQWLPSSLVLSSFIFSKPCSLQPPSKLVPSAHDPTWFSGRGVWATKPPS